MRPRGDDVLGSNGAVIVHRDADVDDAIAAANTTENGVQAGIFSNDLQVIQRAYRPSP